MVTKPLIDAAKVVEIEKEHSHEAGRGRIVGRLPILTFGRNRKGEVDDAGSLNGVAQALGERRAVRQASEAVVQGVETQALLRGLVVGERLTKVQVSSGDACESGEDLDL